MVGGRWQVVACGWWAFNTDRQSNKVDEEYAALLSCLLAKHTRTAEQLVGMMAVHEETPALRQ